VRTVDEILIRAPLERVFQVASGIECWPAILPHYRWVRFLHRRDGGGTVEMAAWRPFGLLRYPVWWVSEMTVDRRACEVRYRHVRGITRGMDVVWRLVPQRNVLQDSALPSPSFRVGTRSGTAQPETVLVTVVHEWRGPAWPLVGPLAASLVIGPVFIRGIASRTLAGIKRELEREHGPRAAGPGSAGLGPSKGG
jgi:hypothetical protein